MYIPGGLIIGAIIGWAIWSLSSSLEEWLSDRREFKEMARYIGQVGIIQSRANPRNTHSRKVPKSSRTMGSTIAPIAKGTASDPYRHQR